MTTLSLGDAVALHLLGGELAKTLLSGAPADDGDLYSLGILLWMRRAPREDITRRLARAHMAPDAASMAVQQIMETVEDLDELRNVIVPPETADLPRATETETPSREWINISTGAMPSVVETRAGTQVRRASLVSLMRARMLRNPCVLGECDLADHVYDYAEYMWLHCAPIEDIRRAVARWRFAPLELRERVIDWAMSVPITELPEMVQCIFADKQAIRAASVRVIDEHGEQGKNLLTHPEK